MRQGLITFFLCLLLPLSGLAISDDDLLYWKSGMNTTAPSAPLGEWSCAGSGKTAKDVEIGESGVSLPSLFPKGSPAYVPIDFDEYGIVYVSNSSTVEGGKADEWLISPEIDLSDAPEHLILSFDVFAYGGTNDPLFGVYASAGGDKPADFTQTIYSGKTVNGFATPAYKRYYLPMNKIPGGKMRIALVNMSRNAMLLGFRNVEIREYQLDVLNHLGSYYETPQDLTVSLDVDIQTPVACDGFRAVLKMADGKMQEYVTSRPIGSAYTHVAFSFPDKLHVDNGDAVDYTVEITPAYEGASTSVFQYSLVCNNGYESVCVLEEMTGAWCMWCPRGAAALSYFSDKYKDRFIGIAVHSDDPMAVDRYIGPIKEQSGVTGFPNGWFGRQTDEDPFTPEVVEQILSRRSGYSVSVKKVNYDESTGRMTVSYAPKVAFTSKSEDLTAVVVVTEDKVKGNNSRWNQLNGYSGATKDYIEESFGADSWPYFKQFCESGTTIPYSKMEYDHVAAGIWNTYLGGGDGAVLPKEWAADTEQEFSISFELPKRTFDAESEGILNWKNTHAIVLLLDRGTGKVLNAAKMGADEYNIQSSVSAVETEQVVSVARSGGNVVVTTPRAAKVALYNVNGHVINTTAVSPGTTEIASGNLNGPVIVSVTDGKNTYVKKLIF